MVVPLIVGAARVVGGEVARKGSTATVSKIENQSRRASSGAEKTKYQPADTRQRDSNNATRNRYNPIRYAKNSQNETENAKKGAITIKRLQAGVTSVTIFWTAIGFWIPQMIFWMVGIFGLGSESIPLFNYVIPGEVIYMLSYIVIVFIGMCTMFYAATVYYFRRVRFFSGYKGIIFIFCIVGYFVIFINFFPWFTIWLLAVTYMQDD